MPITEPRLIELQEHQPRLNVQLTAAQAALLRTNFAQQLTVQRSWVGEGFDLTPGGYVGDIILGDLRLRVQPKVPIENLFYMLTYAAKLAEFRDEQTKLGASDDIFEFIVSIFVKQVDRLVRNGIARGYVELEEQASYLRGRLLMAEHLRRSVVHAGRFHQRATDFTADLRENRILKATLALLARLDYRTDPHLRLKLRRALSAFSEVSFVTVRPEEFDRIIYTRLNARYRSPLALARLLLQHLSLESNEGGTPFAAFLLPMHRVFEEYVSALLRETVGGWPRLGIRVQPVERLDLDGRLPGKPDNIVTVDGRPVLIIDTKYKVTDGTSSHADLYQMAVYGYALGISRAVLLYPEVAPIDTPPYRFPAGPRVEAQVVRLDGDLATFRARWEAWAQRTLAEALAVAADSPHPAPTNENR